MSAAGGRRRDPRDLTLGVRAGFIAEAYAPYLRPGMRVLDVGCGNAVVSGILAERFRLDLHGCDVDDYRKRGVPFTLLGPDGRLPFADGAFDAAMLNDVLHHAPDQASLLRESARVARRVLAFELEPGPLAALFDRFANFFHHRAMPVPLAFRGADGWRAVLAEAGVRGAVVPVGRPRPWYPFRHILIAAPDDEARAADQPADGNIHP